MPGYEGINAGVRGFYCRNEGTNRIRGYQYPGYEGINSRGTRILIAGVRESGYPGYDGMNSRGTREWISGERERVYIRIYCSRIIVEGLVT